MPEDGKASLYDLARKWNIFGHKMGREWWFDAAELLGSIATLACARRRSCTATSIRL